MDCELDGCGIDLLIVDVDGTFSTFGMAEVLLVVVDMTIVDSDVLSKKEYCATRNAHCDTSFNEVRCLTMFACFGLFCYLRLVYMGNKTGTIYSIHNGFCQKKFALKIASHINCLAKHTFNSQS